jgi:hypothetical protein
MVWAFLRLHSLSPVSSSPPPRLLDTHAHTHGPMHTRPAMCVCASERCVLRGPPSLPVPWYPPQGACTLASPEARDAFARALGRGVRWLPIDVVVGAKCNLDAGSASWPLFVRVCVTVWVWVCECCVCACVYMYVYVCVSRCVCMCMCCCRDSF